MPSSKLHYISYILETVLPQLLNALCSGNLTPVEHLEQQQVRRGINSDLNPGKV